MRCVGGYLRTLRQYARSPKGRRDTIDYLYATGAFFLTVVLVLLILSIAR